MSLELWTLFFGPFSLLLYPYFDFDLRYFVSRGMLLLAQLRCSAGDWVGVKHIFWGGGTVWLGWQGMMIHSVGPGSKSSAVLVGHQGIMWCWGSDSRVSCMQDIHSSS